MIRIKAVDAQNILEVCGLSWGGEGACTSAEGQVRCNVLSIAEAKYDPELHPNAIYNDGVLIGFFMYSRAEDRAETATIRRFMVDGRFRRGALEKKALGHVLRGLKIQGVRRAAAIIDGADENEKQLYLSLGFRFADSSGGECRGELYL